MRSDLLGSSSELRGSRVATAARCCHTISDTARVWLQPGRRRSRISIQVERRRERDTSETFVKVMDGKTINVRPAGEGRTFAHLAK